MVNAFQKISILIPVFNEAGTIEEIIRRVRAADTRSLVKELILVDDASTDDSVRVLTGLDGDQRDIRILTMSRTFGVSECVMAGLAQAKGDAVVYMDCDLQDPPELIGAMYAKLREGYEVVYAKRRSRQGETFIKRMVSHFGYFLINRLSDVQIPRNTGDFRIMTRRVIEELRRLNETHGFLRSLSDPGQ